MVQVTIKMDFNNRVRSSLSKSSVGNDVLRGSTCCSYDWTLETGLRKRLCALGSCICLDLLPIWRTVHFEADAEEAEG